MIAKGSIVLVALAATLVRGAPLLTTHRHRRTLSRRPTMRETRRSHSASRSR
jgi:hypothetical protein